MSRLVKPQKLQKGDLVALVTLSSAGAYKFPDRYAIGKKQLSSSFGIKIIDSPHAKESDTWIYNHPKERLDDLMWAFKNPKVKAIITITGGSDAIRLLSFVKKEHLDIIKKNPKIFIGFSDTTSINYLCWKAGMVSFYGPSVLFGLAENGGIHEYTLSYLKQILFSNTPKVLIENNPKGWTLDRVPWDTKNSTQKRKMQKPIAMKFIQGKKVVEGTIIGGCMDVLEFIKGTFLWPDAKVWQNAILFIEISEDKPSPTQVKYWLRNYGAQGILKVLNGIVFGVPGGDIEFNDPDYNVKLEKHISSFSKYDEAILKVCKEYDREDLPVVTQVQFGHTAPMITLPLGAKAKIDCVNKKLELIESGVE
jgi:muramoyltetrapeptide carboxypeptidase LdcA involved in peptidoglycan recycling